MATYRLPEVGGDVGARAVDDQRVEEDRVPLLHVKMDSGIILSTSYSDFILFFIILILIKWFLTYAVVHLVDSPLPLRVVVLLQLALVRPGLDHQAAVVIVNMLHGSPEEQLDTKYNQSISFNCSFKDKILMTL